MANMEAIHDFLQEAYSEGIIDACETVELFEITEKFNNKKDEEKSSSEMDNIKIEEMKKKKKDIAIKIAISAASLLVLGTIIKKRNNDKITNSNNKIINDKKDNEEDIIKKVFKDHKKDMQDLTKVHADLGKLMMNNSELLSDDYLREFKKLTREADNLADKIVNDCLKVMPKEDVKTFCDKMSKKYGDHATKWIHKAATTDNVIAKNKHTSSLMTSLAFEKRGKKLDL